MIAKIANDVRKRLLELRKSVEQLDLSYGRLDARWTQSLQYRRIAREPAHVEPEPSRNQPTTIRQNRTRDLSSSLSGAQYR